MYTIGGLMVRSDDDRRAYVISVIKASIELWPTLVEISYFQKGRHGLPQLRVHNRPAGERRAAV